MKATRISRYFPLLLLICLPAFAQAQTVQGKVTAIESGERFTVTDDKKQEYQVRLVGIDAPEKEQAFGSAAKNNLTMLINGKVVQVKWSREEKSGRKIARVMVGTQDISLEQLKLGFAWYYQPDEKDIPEAERAVFTRAEQDARTGKRGLWKDANPVPPWEFRRARRESQNRPPVETAKDEKGNETDSQVPSETATPQPPQTPNTDIAPNEANLPATKSRGDDDGRRQNDRGPVIADSSLKIYYMPDCPAYNKVAEQSRIVFKNISEAEQAGFKPAGSCP